MHSKLLEATKYHDCKFNCLALKISDQDVFVNWHDISHNYRQKKNKVMKSNLVSNQRIRFIYLNGIDKSWKVFHFGSSLTKQFYFSKLTWWLCTKTMCCSKRKHQSQVPHCEMGARCMRITLSYYSHCMYIQQLK